MYCPFDRLDILKVVPEEYQCFHSLRSYSLFTICVIAVTGALMADIVYNASKELSRTSMGERNSLHFWSFDLF